MAGRRLLITMLIGCVCVAVFAFVYPMYVIRPNRPQGASELQAALAVRSWAPWLATAAAAGAMMAMLALWRKIGRKAVRALCVAAAALAACFAALTYINVFELMFHPIDTPEAIAAGDATLDPDDMVMAIVVNRQARAYPVRMMGYHHIANDWVGGEPIVATY